MDSPLGYGVQGLSLGLEADDATQRVGVLQEWPDYLLVMGLILTGQPAVKSCRRELRDRR